MSITFLLEELAAIDRKFLKRELRTVESDQGPILKINGKPYLSFCSNNYLGLANHPKVKQAAREAVEQYGFGAGASRLVSGNMKPHMRLEEKIAEFKGTEAALIFPSGYMANLGTICALVSKGDIVISDKLNHASIIDGCRQSGALFRVYAHKDIDRLEYLLQKSFPYRRRLVVTDSIFSMDGDLAPLPDIVRMARKYDAVIMVDDAHAIGVFGKCGSGLIEHFGLEGEVDIIMGSLSKAIGSIGGFITGSQQLIEFLKNKVRSFIFTTALPPAACAAALAGITLIQEDPSLRNKLWENIRYFHSQLLKFTDTIGVESPIIPLIVGSPEDALEVSLKLYQNGIMIPAIRPPTVPARTSRLRLTLMATHSVSDIDRLMMTMREIGFLQDKTS